MKLAAWLRWGFYIVVGILFVVSLLGMFVTGPIVVRVPAADIDTEPSSARLRAAVERMCTELAPRDWRHPENLERVAAWIADEFEDAGLTVELQDYDTDRGRFRNVIGRRPGSDPEAEAIVIGAHYDAVENSPGADDNASGVAVLVELARTLPDVRPRRTHYFVAFATEEPPFFGTEQMGSHFFARRLRDERIPLRLMLSLDLVGYFSDDRESQRFPSPIFRLMYPRRGDFLAVIGDMRSGEAIERAKRGLMSAGRLPVHSFRAPRSTELVHLSDHWSFRQFDLPAVQVTDTAFLRYRHYHLPGDTPDRLDYDRMAEVVRALHGVLWEGG